MQAVPISQSAYGTDINCIQDVDLRGMNELSECFEVKCMCLCVNVYPTKQITVIITVHNLPTLLT